MSIEPSEWSSSMNSVCDQSTSGTSSAGREGQAYRRDVPGTDGEPGDDDEIPQVDLEDFGKVRHEAIEAPKSVVREAKRLLRDVVRSERRAERAAKPKPEKWPRQNADRDK